MTTVILMDARYEPVDVGNTGPMTRTVMALHPMLGALTYLPAARP